jgi:hypothetical protein
VARAVGQPLSVVSRIVSPRISQIIS